MKKIVSLMLAVVLMVSMFAMLGSFTASAETYEINDTVKLTFDGDEPYGIPVHRGTFKGYQDGYLNIRQSSPSNPSEPNYSYFMLGKNGNVGAEPVNAYTNKDAVNADDLYLFEAEKTYRVSFDYKFLEGSYGSGTNFRVYAVGDPKESYANSANSKLLKDRASVYSETNTEATWTADPETNALVGETEWATAEYNFTVKAGDAGFYFGLVCGDQGLAYVAIDNIVIEKVVASYSYNDSGIYTMDEEGLTYADGFNSQGSFVESGDAKHGKVMQIKGASNSDNTRGGIQADAFKLTYGKKYYITFEAKNSSSSEIVTAIGTIGTSRRFYLSASSNSKKAGDGVRYFYDGNEKKPSTSSTWYSGFLPCYSNAWHKYGLIIDTTHEDFETALLSNGTNYSDFWTKDIYFQVGVAYGTVSIDNMQMIEIGEVDAIEAADESALYSIRREVKSDVENEVAYQSAGLRFRGSVAAQSREDAAEIGFVVAPVEKVVTTANWYELENGLNANAKKVVAKDASNDIYYSINDDDTVSYQLILTGLTNEEGGSICARRFAAVMYVKTGETYEYFSLGEMSYNQVKAEYAIREYQY